MGTAGKVEHVWHALVSERAVYRLTGSDVMDDVSGDTETDRYIPDRWFAVEPGDGTAVAAVVEEGGS